MSTTWVFKLKNEKETLRAYINLENKWGMVSRNGKCYRVGLHGTEDIIDYAIEHENMQVVKVSNYKEYEDKWGDHVGLHGAEDIYEEHENQNY